MLNPLEYLGRTARAATLASAALPMLALATPANDDINNATTIPQLGAATTVLLTGATQSASDPSCGATPYQSVWYRYTSAVDQFIQAQVSATTGSTPLRPRMAVWSGAPGSLSLVQCNSDAHAVEFNATAGTPYYVEIYSPADNGETTLNLNFNPHAYVNPGSAIPPLNDLYWFAQTIPGVPWTTNADVGAATGDVSYDPLTPCTFNGSFTTCYPYGDTLWYQFTATSTQQLDALFASDYYAPVVQVMTGTLDSPVLVANSTTPGASKSGATRFTTQPGVTYMIEFAAGVENSGDAYADLALRPSPPVTPGTITAVAIDKIYHRWVWTDPYYQRQTHVVVSANVTCQSPIASVRVNFGITQGTATGSGSGTAACTSGSGTARMDAIVSNSFKAGSASVSLSAADYDSNYYVTAGPTPVKLKASAGP